MRRVVLAGIILAALIVLGFVVRQRAHSARAASAPATLAPSAEPVTHVAAARVPSPLAVSPNVVVTALDREYGETKAPVEDPLTSYIRINQYPPTSRPLSIHHDLVAPNRRYESPHPTSADSEVSFWFSGDKGTIVGDDILHAFLEVRRGGEPIDVKILSAAADQLPIAFAKKGDRYLSDVRLADGKYTGAATVNIRVEFEFAPGQTQVASFPLLYTPARTVPARFTGTFREAIVDGSLVVYAGVEVKQAGWYLIDANLWAADNSPVAWTRYKGNLGPNDKEVALSFFGKVLVDANVPAPYQVRQLRGARHVERQDPDIESMPFFDGTYTTRAYAEGAFSPAEWDSEHKRQMIQLLTEQAKTGRHNPARNGDPALAEPSD